MRDKEITRKITYFTFIDQYSPVYNSQVIEQCISLNGLGYKVEIFAFLPLTNYFKGTKQIKIRFSAAKTLPIITRLYKRTWYQTFIAKIILRTINSDTLITRSLYSAPVLALVKTQRPQLRIIYDVRGAAPEELIEYNGNEKEAHLLNTYERLMLRISEKQITVSNALRIHLQNKHLKTLNSTKIPCCIRNNTILTQDNIIEALSKRSVLYSKFKTLYVYSGSLSAWNFSNNFLSAIISISKNPENGVIILSHEKEKLANMINLKRENIFINTLTQNSVMSHLAMCDYGILIRDRNITNKVAAPSKFAEYLGAGLCIIISQDLGDYSDFVISKNCGVIFGQTNITTLPPLTLNQRVQNTELAKQYFTRETIIVKNAYHKLLE